jgi:hypothetical protein
VELPNSASYRARTADESKTTSFTGSFLPALMDQLLDQISSAGVCPANCVARALQDRYPSFNFGCREAAVTAIAMIHAFAGHQGFAQIAHDIFVSGCSFRFWFSTKSSSARSMTDHWWLLVWF